MGIDTDLITGIAAELQSFASISKKIKDVDKALGDRIHSVEKEQTYYRVIGAIALALTNSRIGRELVEGPLPFQRAAGATQCGCTAVGAPMRHRLPLNPARSVQARADVADMF